MNKIKELETIQTATGLAPKQPTANKFRGLPVCIYKTLFSFWKY